MSTVSALSKLGFSSQFCPVTQVSLPNMTRSFDGFTISYANFLSHYGSDTTAIVLNERVFFILNGYHADALVESALHSGFLGCMTLFVDKIDQANPMSEHLAGFGVAKDQFNLHETVLEALGRDNLNNLLRKVLKTHRVIDV